MSHINAKKQEELCVQKVKDLLALPENKKCFDCPTRSPFFVNVSIQTFVCTRCSGLVREVGHRVKSISASKFSGPEILSLQQGGNGIAQRIWLSKYKMTDSPEAESDNDVRLFMRQKYYEQKWLDPLLLKEHVEHVTGLVKSMFTEEGQRRARISSPPLPRSSTDLFNGKGLGIQSIQSPPLNSDHIKSPTSTSHQQSGSPLTINPIQPYSHQPYSVQQSSPVEPSSGQSFIRPAIMSPSKSWMDDNLPIGLTPVGQSLRNALKPLKTQTEDIFSDEAAHTSPLPSGAKRLSLSSPTPLSPSTTTNKFLSELEGLESHQHNKPTYNGGFLVPSSPGGNNGTPVASNFALPLTYSAKSTQERDSMRSNSVDLDPYAALRGLSISSTKQTSTHPKTLNERQRPQSYQFGSSDSYGSLHAPESSKSSNLFGDFDPLAQFKK